jgi:predicted nucleic acid-binding protein
MFYLDASALVKNYLQEPHTEAVRALFSAGVVVGTGLLSKAEVAAAFAEAARAGYITSEEARAAWDTFHKDWPTLISLAPTEALLDRAATLALTHHLRGYDAVHLASALAWQSQRAAAVTLATFDRQLWNVGKKAGLAVWPPEQP